MSLPTKLSVVLRSDLQTALAVNAAAVLCLSLGGRLPELLGEDGKDASGTVHGGLNTHPVPILTATPEEMHQLRDRARDAAEVIVVSFNEVARRARDYENYLRDLEITPTGNIDYVGVAVFGPRNVVTKLTKRLPLMC
ncbi:MAG: DUF2000 domain-containing protein [Pseudonocardiaceae bacterium]